MNALFLNLHGIILFFFLLSIHSLNAQQTPHLGNFQENWQEVNPAVMDRFLLYDSDMTDMWVVSGQYYTDFPEGAPMFLYTSYQHRPVVQKGHWEWPITLGGTVLFDKTDAFNRAEAYFNFSYYIDAGNHLVHFGLSPGVICHYIDLQSLKFKEQEILTDVRFDNTWFFDMPAGVHYSWAKKFYLGAAVPQWGLFRGTIAKPNRTGGITHGKNQVVNLVAGGFIKTGKVKFEPSGWLRYAQGVTYANTDFPFSPDVNLRVHFLGREIADLGFLWVGAGYGRAGTVHGEMGINLEGKKALGRDLKSGADSLTRFYLGFTIPYSHEASILGYRLELTATHVFKP